jgi:hypothetical protein
VSLARLLGDQDKRAEAHDLLAPVYTARLPMLTLWFSCAPLA